MLSLSSFSGIFWILVSILIGELLGKLTIGRIRFGSAAVLFFSVFLGRAILSFHSQAEIIIQEMKTVSGLGTALFLSVIGVTSGKEIDSGMDPKKGVLSFLVGSVAVGSGILCLKALLAAFPSWDKSFMIGLLCGALTSTPGMSVAQERTGFVADRITIGYGTAYLFGVLFAVLAIQLIDRKKKVFPDNTSPSNHLLKNTNTGHTFFLILMSVVFGNVLGKIKIPGASSDLGSSFGILTAGILCSLFFSRFTRFRDLDQHMIKDMRYLGLVLFLAASGISAGINMRQNFLPLYFLFGALFALLPILTCVLLSAVIFHFPRRKTAYLVAGTMTSTPALGLLIDSKSEPYISSYSFCYLGALITIVTGMQFL